MTITENTGLSAPRRTVIMRTAVMLATIALVGSFAERAAAQQPQGKHDDLDVTMQIIVDPDAKLPDEVVRRIPLPARKPAESPPSATGRDQSGKPETAGAGKDNKEHANEAREHGREASEAAKERSREATEQREAARRAEAEERRRERGPPDDRPDPPNRPPHN